MLITDANCNQHKCVYEIHNQFDRYNNISKIEIRLFMEGDSAEEWFDFKLAPIANNELKVTDMFIGKNAHRRKGIPEALILEAKRIFDKRIISSSNKQSILIAERRSRDATKVWERLVNKGFAIYNEAQDIFEIL
jgi:hypothetical protein